MTEVDIYSKYIEDLGFKFKDESTFGHGLYRVNKLHFEPYKKVVFDSRKTAKTYHKDKSEFQITSIILSFNFEDEVVVSIRIDYVDNIRTNGNDWCLLKTNEFEEVFFESIRNSKISMFCA
jgi:hypothetical protein